MMDFVIGGLVLIAVILAVRKAIKNRKGGGCDCAGCSSDKSCHVIERFEAEAKEMLKEKNNV